MSSNLTFINTEAGKKLRDRFGVLLGGDTRLLDCLAGYVFISAFHKLHPALTKKEQIRILTRHQDRQNDSRIDPNAKEQHEFVLKSLSKVRERVPGEILNKFPNTGDLRHPINQTRLSD